MLHASTKSWFRTATLLLVIMLPCVFSRADDKPAPKYDEAGNVLSTIDKHGHFYQVATESRIYLLLCTKVKEIQFGSPECKVGGKPIAKDDTVHFRIEGDWAYMPPASEGMEEKLRILTTELKVIPPLPTMASTTNTPGASTSTNSKDSKSAAPEPAVVIGTGVHVKGQHGASWSTTPLASSITTASASTPVMPTGPVVATPVTGGAPVVVVPTGPTTGGVVTGVPVTGGAPVTAIPVAPVAGVPVGGAPPGGAQIMIGGGAPQWVHVLRVQTADKIYQLECSGKPCKVADREIALRDALTLRVEKKHAYLSFGGQGSTAEQEFKILGVTESGSAPDSKPQ